MYLQQLLELSCCQARHVAHIDRTTCEMETLSIALASEAKPAFEFSPKMGVWLYTYCSKGCLSEPLIRLAMIS